MSDMSPAEELLAAAKCIRGIVAGVSPAPWTLTPCRRKGTKVIAQYDLRKPPRPGSNIAQVKPIYPTNQDELYSAAMHPGIALAMAGWMEAEAARPSARRHGNRCTEKSCTLHAALHLAREFLPAARMILASQGGTLAS